MRQITKDAYSAFKLRERFKSSNTEVRISGDGVYLLLYDNTR